MYRKHKVLKNTLRECWGAKKHRGCREKTRCSKNTIWVMKKSLMFQETFFVCSISAAKFWPKQLQNRDENMLAVHAKSWIGKFVLKDQIGLRFSKLSHKYGRVVHITILWQNSILGDYHRALFHSFCKQVGKNSKTLQWRLKSFDLDAATRSCLNNLFHHHLESAPFFVSGGHDSLPMSPFKWKHVAAQCCNTASASSSTNCMFCNLEAFCQVMFLFPR